MKPPDTSADKQEGHAMLAVGFDSVKRLFLVQNSWGDEDWPEKDIKKKSKDKMMYGRCWIPYEWFEGTINNLASTYDFWVIKTQPLPAKGNK